MKKNRQEKGITLIALIITIVVLLLIAIVSIGTVKESKIIGHAESAASEYVIAQEKEKIALAYSEYQIQKALNQNTGVDTLIIEKANIESIGNYGWKILYKNTGNVYGINSKGEYDEAISTIIKAVEELKKEHGDTISVGVEDFFVYEDKYAIKQNATNTSDKLPEKYIFYNWATVDVNDIEKIEARTITSQPENALICDMSNRALAYDLNGDGYIDTKDVELISWLMSYITIEELNEYIPAYTMEKNIKYSSLLGLGGETFDAIGDVPVLFCSVPEIYYQYNPEGMMVEYLNEGVSESLQEIIQTIPFLYYTHER